MKLSKPIIVSGNSLFVGLILRCVSELIKMRLIRLFKQQAYPKTKSLFI